VVKSPPLAACSAAVVSDCASGATGMEPPPGSTPTIVTSARPRKGDRRAGLHRRATVVLHDAAAGVDATGRQPDAPAGFGGTDRASATRIRVGEGSAIDLWPRAPSFAEFDEPEQALSAR
jgi:hypothetical protein